MKITTKSFRLISSFVFLLLIGAALTASAQNNAPGGYRLLKKIEVGGEGGWDYLLADANAHRLYISHATKVVVIDTEKDVVVGEITNTNGVHGIAVDEDAGRGFISA